MLLLWADFDPKLRSEVGATASNMDDHQSHSNATSLNCTLSDEWFQEAKTGNGPAVSTRPGPSALAEGSGQLQGIFT